MSILDATLARTSGTADSILAVSKELGLDAAKVEKANVGSNLQAHLGALKDQMRKAAENLEFEEAARLRDEIKRLEAVDLAVADDPLARQSAVEQAVENAAKAEGRNRVTLCRPAACSLLGWLAGLASGRALFQHILDRIGIGLPLGQRHRRDPVQPRLLRHILRPGHTVDQ